MKRVFVIVLDSFGVGEAPDAYKWGDEGSNTLGAIRNHPNFDCPNLKRLGLFNIDGVGGGVEYPLASYCRLEEISSGKDTTTGHWEIAGLVSEQPFPTYPDGFPADVLDEFTRLTGRGVLCNLPYSGTEVIKDYGREHVETGKLIVYTSADSVFQIAAHEDVVPVDELYRYCELARKMLQGKHGVGRVIARPFTGEWPYTRTPRRHDFSLVPPKTTMLDSLSASGYDVVTVGKIYDIFAGKGISPDECRRTQNNAEGMKLTSELADRDFNGLCFVNLVDFDMTYGHRNDVPGYARAAAEFDRWLGTFLPKLGKEDCLLITADHGCDPATPSTDHSREYIPMLLYGPSVKSGVNLGTRRGFSDISATVLDLLGCDRLDTAGNSFASSVIEKKLDPRVQDKLMDAAVEARRKAYCPYSGFSVGAALMTASGKIYTGCNIENAAFGPGNCAERTAIFKAVSEGHRSFRAIAICGGKAGFEAEEICAPCGVCRQVMAEFCGPDFTVILGNSEKSKQYRFDEILPLAFGPENLGKK